MALLGRARRLADSRLTLESLERMARRSLGSVAREQKPPRFLVWRYMFMVERATLPWLTNQMAYEAEHERWPLIKAKKLNGEPRNFVSLRILYGAFVLAAALAVLFGVGVAFNLTLGFMIGMVLLWGILVCVFVTLDRYRTTALACRRAIEQRDQHGTLPVEPSVSAVMLAHLERVMTAATEDLVGA
ncbi:MAG: hypothetical protein AAB570_02210, partial [Patescibacteria group bacterium]